MSFKAEDVDIDAFLNLDGHFHSPSLANINKGKGVITPQFQQPPIEKINTYAPLQNSQNFSGPSHQYDLHKQHIPLPPGALANSLAAAQPNFQFNGYAQYGMGSNSGFFGEDLVDFGSMNGAHRPSFGGSNDMDMDFDSPVDGMYMDPNAMGGHEEDSPVPARAEIVRVYPGMHAHQAQQAALAKQQQNELRKQQSQRLPVQSHKPSVSRSVKAPADPVVEERISRLLSQMRQTANVPVRQHGDDNSPQPLMRSKKDEEDMDEDERLLASEEGKKLSSKERRQLRNKVSARAFRSRRKEYIGQLEGEVAQKSNESEMLRAENEALKAENTRLTDLTKLLLSSSAFSSFLNDLSTNGLPQSILTAPTQPSQSLTPQPAPSQSRMPTPQPQMNTIIEEDIDFNSLDVNSNWNSGMDFSFAPQVFAVTELPEGPVIDVEALSGKSSIVPEISIEEKDMVPTVEVAPVLERTEKQFVCNKSVDFDESDPAFALFLDTPSAPTEPVYEVFGSISFEKATETFDLIIGEESDSEDGIVSAATMARFERLSATLDAISLRL